MFVARYTNNPEGDIQRGWSGFMGAEAETVQKFVALFIYDAPEDADEMSDDALLDWLLDTHDIDLRYDEALGAWRQVHHDGLSCWPLDAETAEEACAEAAEMDKGGKIAWAGFGSYTQGKVRYVGRIEGTGDPLHIFECDHTQVEA